MKIRSFLLVVLSNVRGLSIQCPIETPYVVGIYGTSGWWINTLGVLCAAENLDETIYGTKLGTSHTGSDFELRCKNGSILQQFNGICQQPQTYIRGLQIVCVDFLYDTVTSTLITNIPSYAPCGYSYSCGSDYAEGISFDWESDPYYVDGFMSLQHADGLECFSNATKLKHSQTQAPTFNSSSSELPKTDTALIIGIMCGSLYLFIMGILIVTAKKSRNRAKKERIPEALIINRISATNIPVATQVNE